MLDVLSRTLGDPVESFAQVDQLLNQLLPGRLLLLPRLGLPRLRQSFLDHAIQLDPPLYLGNTIEHIESNVDLQRSLQESRQIRLFPDHPHFVGIPGVRSCAQRRKFSSVVGQVQKKARSPLHNAGSILRSDHLWVYRVSAMMITLSFTSTSRNMNVSSERTPEGLSVSSFENGTYKQKTFGSFSANSLFNLVTESSVNCRPFFPGSIFFSKKKSDCLRARFGRRGHHIHDRSAVRDSVSL